MFTGLVQDIGIVRSVDDTRGDVRFEIETDMEMHSVPDGASICCSGACMTVVNKSNNSFFIDVSKESLNRTTIGAWRVMTRINIEPSLRLGDEMGGHIVSGHVDGLAKVEDIKEEGGSHRLKIAVPAEFAAYIAEKGSVTLDGVSLTVNEVDGNIFGVNIIPHTWENTTLSDRKVGDHLNLEIDMLARYVARMLEFKA